ncbi:MAG: hypothetical protein ACRD21_11970 [Vicinamibacteria bacterium]
MIRRHAPILRTALAASMAFIGLSAAHWPRWPGGDDLAHATAAGFAFWFLSGILYVQFLEYGTHRYAMHRGLPLLRHVRRNHFEHHRIFHGENFRTSNPPHLAHIPGRWWIFPLFFSLHYAIVTAILPLVPAVAFLSACFVHYLAFELTHWFTHVDDNAFDRALAKIPVLSAMRAYQIEHHRIHHETPVVAFNFNPPYLGDVVAGQMPVLARAEPAGRIVPEPAADIAVPSAALPRPAPVVPRRRLVFRPILLYGAALLLGAAAVGVAVLAHSKSTPGGSAPRTKA